MAVSYDPNSPELQANLYDTYRWLRDEHPVYHNRERDLWIVTRYDDVSAVLRDDATYSSAGVEEAQLLLPMLVFLDDPRHRKLRNLLASVFTPRRVAQLESQVRQAANDLVDSFAARGRCELMTEFATQLPSIVIGALIGVPESRRATFLRHTGAMIETGPGGHPIEEPAGGIYREFATLLAERRAERAEDLMSALIHAEVDGERLDDDEVLGFCFNLIVGGTDTVMNLIGNGAVLLNDHPDQRKYLADDLARIPDAVEEILRFESPAQALPRRPLRAVEMHGVEIPAECRLTVCFGAANHDERAFERPESFDVRRRGPRHLAFGLGAHHCVGASLARLEGRIAFEVLLERFPDYRLEHEPGWVTSRWARSHPEVRLVLSP